MNWGYLPVNIERLRADFFETMFSLRAMMPDRGWTGPGRKTLYTWHKRIGSSRYKPHQGSQKIARRLRQAGRS